MAESAHHELIRSVTELHTLLDTLAVSALRLTSSALYGVEFIYDTESSGFLFCPAVKDSAPQPATKTHGRLEAVGQP